MANKRPAMVLEGMIALFFAALAGVFFFWFFEAKILPDHPTWDWVPYLNFPVTGILLALALYFFFPNQTWKMPIIGMVCLGMVLTGFPPMEKLNFGLDLAGGTEIMVKIAKSAKQTRMEQVNIRILDIEDYAKGQEDEITKGKIEKTVQQLRAEKSKLDRNIAKLGQNKKEQAKLIFERNAIRQRISDLTGEGASEAEALRKEYLDLDKNKDKTDIGQVIEILRERINATSLTEIKIARAGEERILIQIPGLDEGRVQIIKNVIERQGILEFRLVHKDSDTDAMKNNARDEKPIAGYILKKNKGGINTYVSQEVSVSGSDVAAASAKMAGVGGWEVALKFSAAGRRKFAEVTKANIGRQLAIILDDELMLAPVIKSAIDTGEAVINNDSRPFTKEYASEIVAIIQAGSLPVKLTIDSENKVGSSLGEDSINSGQLALVVGFALVVIIMILYYLGAGVLSIIALLLNALLIIGILGLFKATLTLPGIAGIVLTLGMAVDANVLIFERIREEKASGKALKTAIKLGYERAFVTILDANITTIITAIILYSVGTVFIKSFAVTLIVGLLASMFTAVFVTRNFVEICYNGGIVKELKMLLLFKTPKIDFLSMKNMGVIASTVLIVAGLFTFATTANYGIDFTGGQMVQIRTTSVIPISKIRTLVDKQLGEGVTVQSFHDPDFKTSSNEGVQFVITFPTPEEEPAKEGEEKKEVKTAQELKEEVKSFLRDNLPELAPEAFKSMVKVPNSDAKELGLKGLESGDYIKSAFFNIELCLLEKPGKTVTAEDVKNAINSIDFDAGINPQESLYVYNVEGEGNMVKFLLRTRTLTEYVDQENAEHEIRAEISSRLKKSDITLSDPFPREQSVGRSLSKDLQTMAIWAIILSSIAMLIYITFRFTFAFGLGAVFALFHDLFMTLGIIAILRVDITLDVLAAILTVLGYSLNDTIVVFDRIRENMKLQKKKDFTHVLNDSINQVLARTVLTSVTTAAVILALIFLAGDVLRGFSITLLVGVITGTYSSIFIATPVVAAYDSYKTKRDEKFRRANAE